MHSLVTHYENCGECLRVSKNEDHGLLQRGQVKMGKNKIIVRIAGMEYVVTGVEPTEYILKVAQYVDRKTSEVTRYNPTLSTSHVAVLTSLNIGDDVLKLQENIQNAYHEIAELKRKNQVISEEAQGMKKEINAARESLSRLKTEVMKRDVEVTQLRNIMNSMKKESTEE
jgi:cell division protein ZapA